MAPGAVVDGAFAVVGVESAGSDEPVASESGAGGINTSRSDLPVISTSNCQALPSSAMAVHV